MHATVVLDHALAHANGNRLCYPGCHVVTLVKMGEPVQNFAMRSRTKLGRGIWLNISIRSVANWIGDVAEVIAQEVHGPHREHDAETEEGGDPSDLARQSRPSRHASPLRLRRLPAQAEDAEGGRRENCRAEAKGGRRDHRGHHVGQDGAGEDAEIAPAEGPGPTRAGGSAPDWS